MDEPGLSSQLLKKRAKNAEYRRNRRAAADEQTLMAMRKKDAERKRAQRARQQATSTSPSWQECEKRAKNAEYGRNRRAAADEEKLEARRKKDAERKRAQRAIERATTTSPSWQEFEKRAKYAEYRRNQRAAADGDTLKANRMKDAERRRAQRYKQLATTTDLSREECEKRAKYAEYKRKKRAATDEQTLMAIRKKDAERKRAKRAIQRATSTSYKSTHEVSASLEVDPLERVSSLNSALNASEFGHACSVCDRLMFLNDLSKVPIQCLAALESEFPNEDVQHYMVCSSCKDPLLKGNLPHLSRSNGNKYPTYPDSGLQKMASTYIKEEWIVDIKKEDTYLDDVAEEVDDSLRTDIDEEAEPESSKVRSCIKEEWIDDVKMEDPELDDYDDPLRTVIKVEPDPGGRVQTGSLIVSSYMTEDWISDAHMEDAETDDVAEALDDPLRTEIEEEAEPGVPVQTGEWSLVRSKAELASIEGAHTGIDNSDKDMDGEVILLPAPLC